MFGRKSKDSSDEPAKKSGFEKLSEASAKEGGLGAWNEIAKGCAGVESASFNLKEAEKARERGDKAEEKQSNRWVEASLDSAEKSLKRGKDIVEAELEKRDNETGERKRGWFR